MNELAYLWHVVDDETKAAKIKELKSTLYKRRSRLGLARDLYHIWRLFS